ncbi:MAG: hypothetical protein NTW87_02450 [Planctomycetota bacterium]|nr:hypothetical protein [Planctomycetota bacterium]
MREAWLTGQRGTTLETKTSKQARPAGHMGALRPKGIVMKYVDWEIIGPTDETGHLTLPEDYDWDYPYDVDVYLGLPDIGVIPRIEHQPAPRMLRPAQDVEPHLIRNTHWCIPPERFTHRLYLDGPAKDIQRFITAVAAWDQEFVVMAAARLLYPDPGEATAYMAELGIAEQPYIDEVWRRPGPGYVCEHCEYGIESSYELAPLIADLTLVFPNLTFYLWWNDGDDIDGREIDGNYIAGHSYADAFPENDYYLTARDGQTFVSYRKRHKKTGFLAQEAMNAWFEGTAAPAAV